MAESGRRVKGEEKRDIRNGFLLVPLRHCAISRDGVMLVNILGACVLPHPRARTRSADEGMILKTKDTQAWQGSEASLPRLVTQAGSSKARRFREKSVHGP